MKKSLLALVVTAATLSTANAANIYDKDGTSLKVDGRVQALFLSGSNGKAGVNDSTLQNSARFGIGGATKLSFVTLSGYSQWDMADGSSKKGDTISGRDQFVQADFGSFGALKAGRYKGAATYVSGLTDVYDDFGCNAQSANDERNSGRLEYSFSNSGFDLKLGGLFSNDDYKLENGFSKHKKVDVEGGATIAAGYTIDSLPVIDSLTIRAAYEMIKGQNDKAAGTLDYINDLDKVNSALVGVAVGNAQSGFYSALMYNTRDFELKKIGSNQDKDLKTCGLEFAVGYAFDCGVNFKTGYNVISYEQDGTGDKYGNDKLDYTLKSIPVYLNYKINPNFNVWAEARFDVTNEKDMKGLNAYKVNAPYLKDKNYAEIGARYSF